MNRSNCDRRMGPCNRRGSARRQVSVLATAACVALGVVACASTPKKVAWHDTYCVSGHGCYRVLASAAGYRDSGVASWYGQGDAGRPTASGASFDPYAMRIAQKTLPFGTWVRIHNVDNGREAVAMVDDRGPFYGGRIIDATPAVARQLGFFEDGTAQVRVAAIPLSELSAAQRQAARADEQRAIVYARRHPHEILAEAGHVAVRGVYDITVTGVRIGVGVVRVALELALGILKAL